MSGVTVTLMYLFGPVPLYLATARVFATPAQLTSGFFVAFLTAGVVTIALSVRYRQPLAIGWTGPGLVYMAAMASQYSVGHFAGATLFAGLAMVLLAVTGLAERLARALPVPVVLAVFAGSSLHFCTAGVAGVQAEPLAAGALVAGFFAARRRPNRFIPPLGLGCALGLLVLAASGGLEPASFQAGMPAVEFVRPVVDPSAIVAVGLPLVLLAVGLQNMQGFGGLRAAGYEPPFRLMTAVMGGVSMVHASVGAPPSGMQTTPLFIMAGDQSGPKESRWIAAVVASVGCLAIAAGAVTVAAFVSALPLGFVAATVGIILLATVFDSLRSALSGPMAFPAFVAFVVAASDLSIAGMGAPLWALVIGAVATAKMASLQQQPANAPAPARA
jgi:benzoate membrane transport protein